MKLKSSHLRWSLIASISVMMIQLFLLFINRSAIKVKSEINGKITQNPIRIPLLQQKSDVTPDLHPMLTASELTSLRILEVNEAFRDRVEKLLLITDPYLTCDELYDLSEKRKIEIINLLKEWHERIRQVTGTSWIEYQMRYGWNKHITSIQSAAHYGKLDPLSNKLVPLIYDVRQQCRLNKLNIFDVKSQRTVDQTNHILGDGGNRLKAELADPKYLSALYPLLATKLFSRWEPKYMFGSELPPDQIRTIISTVMNEVGDNFALVEDESEMRSIPEQCWPELRKIVGEQAFLNFLKFSNPELKWSDEMHLNTFQLEEKYKSEFLAQTTKQDGIREQFSRILKTEFDTYLLSNRGNWLLPYLKPTN